MPGMTRSLRLFACCALLWSTIGSSSLASEAQTLIDQAYQLTNSAQSLDDYSTIIQLCGDAEKATLTSEQAAYVKSLLAWSYNRRGEVLTEQATAAFEQGEAAQARSLDGKALADFEASLQLDPKRWKTWHNRAVSHAIAGKHAAALADFGRVVELKPDYANAWFNRAEILYDLGKVEESIADYSEAIKIDGQDAGAYASRAHAYFRLGKNDEALADYTRAIELAPESADMLANRGDALQSLGKWLEAAEDFRTALQRDKDSPRVLQSAAWLMATCPQEDLRNAEMSVQAAEKAVALLESHNQQPDARYLDTLAAAYATAGRFEEAVAQITAAIQIAPTELRSMLEKRLALYQKRQAYRQGVGEKTASAPKAKKAR